MLNRSFDNALVKSRLFAGVDEQTVSSVAGSLAEESWSKGQLIMGPADSVESFRRVIEGRVKIVRSNSIAKRTRPRLARARAEAADLRTTLQSKGAHERIAVHSLRVRD
jgi:hypothetical protein